MKTRLNELIAELLKQVSLLGRQIDASEDQDATLARVTQSLIELRAAIEQGNATTDAEADDALAQTTAAIAQLREVLHLKEDDDAALAKLEASLQSGESVDEITQSLDRQTGGAFSRYRAANEARALADIAKDARANADKSAKQVRPNVDAAELLRKIKEDRGDKADTEADVGQAVSLPYPKTDKGDE